jgi:NIMA (never in mitosis gene a)-related kinase
MHAKRIMHRDLKPANIFITADGSLKLGDLGLGRFFSSQTYEAFSRVGTPLYMSPEVLSGNGYDWKSDVWSMGCIAYELVTLRSPFKADDAKMSLYELFQTISKGEYPAIESRYSEELRSLIDMMLRLKPSERYDAEQVMKVCMEQKELVLKRPKIDPFLVMDDIIEKLRLLNYESEFCKRFNRKPISRIFFSHEEDPEHVKFSYFYEIAYWLMSFSKKRTKLIGGITEFNPDLNDESKLKQLMLDLSTFGVKLPENTNTKQTSNVTKSAFIFI